MASIKVTLAGTEYDVPKMNIGQLERVSDAMTQSPVRAAMSTLRIAMERATPKIADFSKVEPDNAEIGSAVESILSLCGLQPVPKKNLEAPAPVPGQPVI